VPPQDNYFILRLTPKFTAVKGYAGLLDREIEALANADAERVQWTEFEDEESQRIEEDEHDWLYNRVVPRSLRYSCIIALMTAVDTALIAICEELRQRGGIALPVSALKGSDREKAMVYLTKVVGVTLPAGWFASRLVHLGAIRNCIVHQDGHVHRAPNPEKLRT
jgi:hypothetical protein